MLQKVVFPWDQLCEQEDRKLYYEILEGDRNDLEVLADA